MSTRRPSLRAVAAHCGLSTATCSMALRRMARVPAPTRRRVEAAAAELGYIRDPEIGRILARSRQAAPKARETLALFLVVSLQNAVNEGRPWLPTIVREARQVAHLLGCEIEPIIVSPKNDLRSLADRLWKRGIRGILVGPYTAGAHIFLQMNWSRFAAVELGRTLQFPQLHRIERSYIDDLPDLFRLLHTNGFRRIGLALNGARRAYLRDLPQALLLLFCQQHEEQFRIPPLDSQDYNPQGFRSWLAAQRPDALIVYERDPVYWLKPVQRRHPELVFLDAPGRNQWGLEADTSAMVQDGIRLLKEMIDAGECGEPARCRSHAYRHLLRFPRGIVLP